MDHMNKEVDIIILLVDYIPRGIPMAFAKSRTVERPPSCLALSLGADSDYSKLNGRLLAPQSNTSLQLLPSKYVSFTVTIFLIPRKMLYAHFFGNMLNTIKFVFGHKCLKRTTTAQLT